MTIVDLEQLPPDDRAAIQAMVNAAYRKAPELRMKLNDEAPCNAAHWHARTQAAETEARTLRLRYGVVSGWIVQALKVLDTLDPEDSAEADELRKLIAAGEVLALTTLANSKTPNVELTGKAGLPDLSGRTQG